MRIVFESVTSYFNGIMFCFIEICSATGNATASVILSNMDRKVFTI